MPTVDKLQDYIDRRSETKSNRGQAKRMDRIASELEDDINHLQKMQRRNLFTDIENDKMTDVINEYTRTMGRYRSDANELRRMK